MRTTIDSASVRRFVRCAVGSAVVVVAATAVLSGLGCSSAPTLPEREVKFDQVPGEVRAALQAKFPDAVVQKIETQNHDGVLIYEFACRSGDKAIEYLFAPGGRYVGTAVNVLETELPIHVLGSFKYRYPGLTIQKAQLETLGEGATAQKVYECSFVRSDGVRVRAKYDERGAFLREDLGQPTLAGPSGGAAPGFWPPIDVGGGPGLTSFGGVFRG